MKWHSNTGKIKRFVQRLSLGLFVVLFLPIWGCQSQSRTPSFEVIGQANLSESSQPFSISDTLNALYSPSGQIFVAQVEAVEGDSIRATVDEVILGNLIDQESYAFNWKDKAQAQSAPSLGKRYLFFAYNEGERYYLQCDESGWLSVENNRVSTASGGASTSMDTVRFEATRIGNTTILPANFYYFWDLEPLVIGSDSIFIGTVRSIRETTTTFYVNDSEVRMNLSDDANIYQLEVMEVWKGKLNEGENVQVIGASIMMKNTIDYTSLQPINLKYSNAPGLFVDMVYLFFVIDSPVSDLNNTNFFVNPIQGMVPVYDRITYSPPSNPVFTAEYDLDELRETVAYIEEDYSEYFGGE